MFASGKKSSAAALGLDWQASVIDIADNTSAPASEVEDDRYLLDTAGGGVHADWDGAAINDIVEFDGTSWVVTYTASGEEGGACWVEDENLYYAWDGSSWQVFGAASPDVKVAVDSGATEDYLGAANNDGVLRTGDNLSYADGGDFVTLDTIQGIKTTDAPEFAGASLKGPVTVHGNNIVTTPVHTGRKERFAGNNGLGQSFPAFVNYEQSAAIAGARTSDTLFTRTAGSWVVDGLIGQWAYFYAAASYEDGAWLKITDNAAGTITVTGQVIFAGADSVKTCPWQPIQDQFTHGKGGVAYAGGVFDGESIWLAPANATDILKINATDGTMTSYTHGQGVDAFSGAVFDGENIWLVPVSSANIIKVDPSDGSMTTYAHGKGASAFHGGVFDGQNVWLVPYTSSDLVKIDPDGGMTSYAHGQTTGSFQGGVYDGENIWLVPHSSANLVKVNPSDGTMTPYAHGKADRAFVGGVFDGENIWLIPRRSDDLVKVNPSTGGMTSYPHGYANDAFYGGVFDGESIWLMPTTSDDLVKVNPSDGTMTPYAHGKGDWAFIGGVFDGNYVWMIPQTSTELVRFVPPRFGRAATVTKTLPLPIQTGGGTVTVSAITGAPSIDFNADGEIVYVTARVPKDWDAISDLVLKAMIQNEIAEDSGDDIDIAWTVHGIADGETNADAGQACAMDLNLAGGDEAQDKVNLAQAVINYDDGSYPIAAGDTLVLKGVVALGTGTECTGPLHIVNHWIEYVAKK